MDISKIPNVMSFYSKQSDTTYVIDHWCWSSNMHWPLMLK